MPPSWLKSRAIGNKGEKGSHKDYPNKFCSVVSEETIYIIIYIIYISVLIDWKKIFTEKPGIYVKLLITM